PTRDDSTRGPGEQVQDSHQVPGRRLDEAFLDALDGIHHTGQEFDRGGLLAQFVAELFELIQRILVAVHVSMEARIDITPYDSAARDQQHADQCDVAVARPEVEVGVKQDEYGPD